MCEQWRIIFLQSTAEREVSESVSRSRIDQAPPEPRARGPRSERDVANDVVFGVVAPEMEVLIRFDEDLFDFVSLVAEVVAVDLLFNHDRLDMEAIAKTPASDWPGD